jgi:adenylosuccinate lyase
MHAWKEGLSFRELVLNNPSIAGRVPREALDRAFDLQRQLRHIDAIFARVFGADHPRARSPHQQKP